MLHAARLRVVCCLLRGVRCMLHAACCIWYAESGMLHVVCGMWFVVCVLHLVHCMWYVACCTPDLGSQRVPTKYPFVLTQLWRDMPPGSCQLAPALYCAQPAAPALRAAWRCRPSRCTCAAIVAPFIHACGSALSPLWAREAAGVGFASWSIVMPHLAWVSSAVSTQACSPRTLQTARRG